MNSKNYSGNNNEAQKWSSCGTVTQMCQTVKSFFFLKKEREKKGTRKKCIPNRRQSSLMTENMLKWVSRLMLSVKYCYQIF